MITHGLKKLPKKILKRIGPNKWQVKVDSIEKYFALPKDQRERFGLYLTPHSLPFDPFDKQNIGWGEFYRKIRQEYPIQWFLREWIFSLDNPIILFFKRIQWKLSDWKYNIKRFIKPCNPRFRKAHPRWAYSDTVELARDVNFALILDFWYEEVVDGPVDWQSEPHHKEFYDWLTGAVNWIEIGRPALVEEREKEADIAFDKSCKSQNVKEDKPSFDDIYGKEISLEREIYNRDTKILQEFVEKREWFWT